MTSAQARAEDEPPRSFIWMDGDGNEDALPIETADFAGFDLSPDGRSIAVIKRDPDDLDRSRGALYTYSVTRGAPLRLTPAGVRFSPGRPKWSPDGSGIFYQDYDAGTSRVAANASVTPELVMPKGEWLASRDGSRVLSLPMLTSVHPEERSLLFNATVNLLPTGSPDWDIYLLSLDEGAAPEPLLVGEWWDRDAQFSPDGLLIAYVSSESGPTQVLLYDVETRSKTPVAAGNGPFWSADGTELFFRAEGQLVVVSVTTDPQLEIGDPMPLFEFDLNFLSTDVSSDGTRFLMLRDVVSDEPQEPVSPPNDEITVVLNWFEELKRLVPTGGR